MSLMKFAVRRMIQIVITLFIIASLIFIIFRILPGGPYAVDTADRTAFTILSPRMTPELKAILRERFGLDKPLWQQYIIYLKNVLKGDFGVSFY